MGSIISTCSKASRASIASRASKAVIKKVKKSVSLKKKKQKSTGLSLKDNDKMEKASDDEKENLLSQLQVSPTDSSAYSDTLESIIGGNKAKRKKIKESLPL